MPLKLYYVNAITEDGDSLDLLARANSSDEATKTWRHHYCLDDRENPSRVGLVPGVSVDASQLSGAVRWEDVFLPAT